MSNLAFTEVTQGAGVAFFGESYGAAWGFFNDDLLPDLWVPNHHDPASLFLNNGDGTFTDIAPVTLQQAAGVDPHGSAWADFDNDGDQDLAVSVGGAFGNELGQEEPSIHYDQLYVNDDSRLDNQAFLYGLENRGGRGRSPLWLDYDNDGLLDILLTNAYKSNSVTSVEEQIPTKFFRQTESGTFIDLTDDVGLPGFSWWGMLADWSGDGKLDLLTGQSDPKIYDISSSGFTDITSEIGVTGKIFNRDAVAADFNGDLKMDLLLSREQPSPDIGQDGSTDARAILYGKQGISFETSGKVVFELRGNHNFLKGVTPSDIFIGAKGVNPENVSFYQNRIRFKLNSKTNFIKGMPPHRLGVDRGIYIGYDEATGKWQLNWSSPTLQALVPLITSETDIENVTPIGFSLAAAAGNEKLLINTGKKFIDKTKFSGLNAIPNKSSSVVAGDFDNDMDVDLYVVTTGHIANKPNILYENLGNGQFVPVTDAGGAAGTKLGLGESVVTADYDLDGYLDFFVTNGRNLTGRWLHEGKSPSQLFKNSGGSNHWLQIDLEGVVSNRDGIGAQVFATANGKKQIREQGGATHLFAQNSQRIHFGLAENTLVDELEVSWSSGINQKLRALAVDQIVKVVEGVGAQGDDHIVGTNNNETLSGKGGNDILRGRNGNDELEGGSEADVLDGGNGIDTATYADALTSNTISLIQGSGTGGEAKGDTYISIENVIGSNFRDLITGDHLNNVLEGGDGADRLIGLGGDDSLFGGRKSDLLAGGQGDDLLSGGHGRDKFKFSSLRQGGIDVIVDFETQVDRIHVKRFFGVGLTVGSLQDSQFTLGTAASTTESRFIYDSTTGNLFFDSDGTGGKKQTLFAVLGNQAVLAANDISIVA